MKSAIVRHILVKDKDLCEQLKKKIKAGADFAKIAKRYLPCLNANCTARLKASLAGICWKLNSGWISFSSSPLNNKKRHTKCRFLLSNFYKHHSINQKMKLRS